MWNYWEHVQRYLVVLRVVLFEKQLVSFWCLNVNKGLTGVPGFLTDFSGSNLAICREFAMSNFVCCCLLLCESSFNEWEKNILSSKRSSRLFLFITRALVKIINSLRKLVITSKVSFNSFFVTMICSYKQEQAATL